MIRNITLILPLVRVAFIEQSVAFITPPPQVRTKLISLPIKDHTYLRQFFIACTDDNLLEGSYSIHR